MMPKFIVRGYDPSDEAFFAYVVDAAGPDLAEDAVAARRHGAAIDAPSEITLELHHLVTLLGTTPDITVERRHI